MGPCQTTTNNRKNRKEQQIEKQTTTTEFSVSSYQNKENKSIMQISPLTIYDGK